MLRVEGRSIAPGRAWARVGSELVQLNDAEDVAVLELEPEWDHLVIIGPSGATAARAMVAFAALDDLLTTAGPTFFFGGVDLPGRWRTAYLDSGIAAGSPIDSNDQRDAILRALREGDAAALGPPLRVTTALFGTSATRPLGRALAGAVDAGRHGALRLAVASAELLGPERLVQVLDLEGDDDDLDVPIAVVAEHLTTVVAGLSSSRRHRVLEDLWLTVQHDHAKQLQRKAARRFAREIASHGRDDPERTWLEHEVENHLRLSYHLVDGFFDGIRVGLAADIAEAAAREIAAVFALLRLAAAERDGHFEAELSRLMFLIERLGESANRAGPAMHRLITLAVEGCVEEGITPPKVDRRLLLYPPLPRRERLCGVTVEARHVARAVDDAIEWFRHVVPVDGEWASLWWREPLAERDPDGERKRREAAAQWTSRYIEGFEDNDVLVDRPSGLDHLLDGFILLEVRKLAADLDAVAEASYAHGGGEFFYQSIVEEGVAGGIQPRANSVARAAAGAAQLVQLGASVPPARSWNELITALTAHVQAAGGDTERLRYPPELAALHEMPAAKTGLMLVVPDSAPEILAWGSSMGNCIGTYIDKVQAGKTFLFATIDPAEPEQPVTNFEVVPTRGGYKVNEHSGRFNGAVSDSVEIAITQIVDGLPSPTRPWPPAKTKRPLQRSSRGGRRSRTRQSHTRAKSSREALDAACAIVLATVDVSSLIPIGAACGATTLEPVGCASAIARATEEQQELALVTMASFDQSFWETIATDWTSRVAAEVGQDGDAVLALLETARRSKGRTGSPSSDFVAVLDAAHALAGTFARLATGGDERLAPLLKAGNMPAPLLAAALLRSGGNAESDIPVPVDEHGLITTRPHTDIFDPEGPWAAAWSFGQRFHPGPVARLLGEMQEAGTPVGRLHVPASWLNGDWTTWAGRAAPALSSLVGQDGTGRARLHAMASLESTPIARLRAIAGYSTELALEVVCNRVLDPETLEMLQRHDDPFVSVIARVRELGANARAAAGLSPDEFAASNASTEFPEFLDVAGWFAQVARGQIPDVAPRVGSDWVWFVAFTDGGQVATALMPLIPPGRRMSGPVAQVAAALTTSPIIMRTFADRGDRDVRVALARNPHLWRVKDLLARLVADVPEVRAALADARATPVEALRALADDGDSAVAQTARRNLKRSLGADIAEALDPKTPVDNLDRLAESDDEHVRIAVATHLTTRKSTRAYLALLDPSPEVRAAARGDYRRR